MITMRKPVEEGCQGWKESVLKWWRAYTFFNYLGRDIKHTVSAYSYYGHVLNRKCSFCYKVIVYTEEGLERSDCNKCEIQKECDQIMSLLKRSIGIGVLSPCAPLAFEMLQVIIKNKY